MIKMHNLLTFKILAWIVILNISMTILHYVDNIIFFHEYPEPPWLTAGIVDAFWFLMTPIGLLGLWFARKERKLQSSICLLTYAAMVPVLWIVALWKTPISSEHA